MTAGKLEQLVKEWQKILRLQDWRISASLVAPDGLDTKGAYGENHWWFDLKQSKVRILGLEHIEADDLFNRDLEQTLVHELLHLHVNPGSGKVGNARRLLREQAIEAMACALVSLKRGKRIE